MRILKARAFFFFFFFFSLSFLIIRDKDKPTGKVALEARDVNTSVGRVQVRQENVVQEKVLIIFWQKLFHS